MKFLLDTDTCIYWLRGRVEVRDRWLSEDPETIAISIITVAELYYGAGCSGNPDANRQAVRDLIAATALSLDLTLVTNNIRHFDRIPKMHLESWAA